MPLQPDRTLPDDPEIVKRCSKGVPEMTPEMVRLERRAELVDLIADRQMSIVELHEELHADLHSLEEYRAELEKL